MKTLSPDFTDTDPAPEIPPGMEQAQTWDDPPAASGVRLPRARRHHPASALCTVEPRLLCAHGAPFCGDGRSR